MRVHHIDNDDKALCSLKNLLHKDGKIFITVPAYQWMYSVHDKNLGHYRRYTRSMLCDLCKKNGFKVLYSGYLNSLLFPLMVIARFVDRLLKNYNNKKIEHSSGSNIPGWGVNTLFNAIFAIESLWIPSFSFPFGGTVTAFCTV